MVSKRCNPSIQLLNISFESSGKTANREDVIMETKEIKARFNHRGNHPAQNSTLNSQPLETITLRE